MADEAPQDHDLIARTKKVSELVKESYNDLLKSRSKLILQELAHVDDDDNYAIPSTPRYSDMSFRHLLKRPTNVLYRESRVFIMVLMSVTFSVQMFSRDIWIPFFEPALVAFPEWSQISLASLSFWNVIMCVLLMVPSCIVINKYGIKTGLLCSCVASTFGTAIRCLPFIGETTFYIHASTVFLSSSSAVAVPLTVTISTCCFRTGEKNLATGCLTSSSLMGSAAGLLVAIVLQASQPLSSSNSARCKTIVTNVMYTCFAMNAACLLLVYVWFPREFNTSKQVRTSTATKKLMPTGTFLLQAISKNIGLACIAFSYMCSNASSWPWYQMIDVTFSKMGYLPLTGENCRFWMIVQTCMLTLVVCWFADSVADSNKFYALICNFLGSAFILCVVWTVTSHQNPSYFVARVMLAFPLQWATQSLFYQMIADNAYPLPENVAVGLVHVLKMIFETFVYLAIAIIPEYHLYWMHWCTFAISLWGFAFLLIFNLKDKSNVNRY